MSKEMPKRGTIEEYKNDDRVLPRKIDIKKGFFEAVKRGVSSFLVTTMLSSGTIATFRTAENITKRIEINFVSEEVNSYWNIVNKLRSLIVEKYNPQTPYEWFAIMIILKYSGVFEPSEYYYDNNNETLSEPGMTTFTKNGVCSHVNEFFTDVLKVAGYDATSVVNSLNVDDNAGLSSLIRKIIPNHMYTMVVYEERTIILDYINCLIFHKVNGKWEDVIYNDFQTDLQPIYHIFRDSDTLKIFYDILFKSESMTKEESSKISEEYIIYYYHVFSEYEEWQKAYDKSKLPPFWLEVRNAIVKDIDIINRGLESKKSML